MKRVVHAALSFPASYFDGTLPQPVGVTVRWRPKSALTGNLGGAGYAEVYETSDVIVFSVEELAGLGLTPLRTGLVAIPGLTNATFQLDSNIPSESPIDLVWSVTRPDPEDL